MTWESLNPTWIDEDQRHHVPKCPSLPKLSIPARMIDVIAIKLPCRNKAYYWSKDVNHLHLQLASAGLATSVKGDYAVHILFISNCTLLPNLFPCKELVTRQGNVWLYKPNLKVLREKLQLPIGSCELALPFNPQEIRVCKFLRTLSRNLQKARTLLILAWRELSAHWMEL
ncbi:UDP-glucuronate:xylan alpha-glucuronosyltransferase 1-like protein [Tanacetum coccineum]